MKRNLIIILFICFIFNLIFIGCSSFGINNSEEQKEEMYTIISGELFQSKGTMVLRTVASWSGQESRIIKYEAKNSPWVINCGAVATSKLGSKFRMTVYKKLNSDISISMNDYGETLIEDTGEFNIEIESSGCKWWVKIGIE